MELTTEQLKELLDGVKTDILSSVKKELSDTLTDVDKKNQGLAASLSRELKKVSEGFKDSQTQKDLEQEISDLQEDLGEGEGESTGKRTRSSKKPSTNAAIAALQKELQALKSQQEQKEKQIAQRERDAHIQSLFNTKNVKYSDKALKAFMLENSEKLQQDGDNWYVVLGEEDALTLDQAVNEFLDSEFGSMFIAPTKGRGMGLKPAKTPPAKTPGMPGGAKEELTLNELLFTDIEE